MKIKKKHQKIKRKYKIKKESDIRNRHHINVLGTKRGEEANLMPPADYIIRSDDHMMIIGKKTDIDKLLEDMK